MSYQLPFNLTVSTDIFDDWHLMDDYEKEETLNDYLSDEYGFCVNTYFYEEHEDMIEITEIDWDTSD